MVLSSAMPAAAQEGNGRSMMERGAELFFRGLREEVGPALGDLQALAELAGPAMRSFVEEMGPALGEIIGEVRDWTRYSPPELLPNGDIIIRRRPDPPPDPDAVPGARAPEGAVDL
jgi:hypothetical protein